MFFGDSLQFLELGDQKFQPIRPLVRSVVAHADQNAALPAIADFGIIFLFTHADLFVLGIFVSFGVP
jgi:uncharacterized protein YcbX